MNQDATRRQPVRVKRRTGDRRAGSEKQRRSTPRGNERPTSSSEKTSVSEIGGAGGGAIGCTPSLSDPDFAAIVDAWPRLAVATKRALISLVREAAEGHG